MEAYAMILKVNEDRQCVARLECQEGPDRLLCETATMKSKLLWRLQDVSDARIMENLLSKNTCTEWNRPKRG